MVFIISFFTKTVHKSAFYKASANVLVLDFFKFPAAIFNKKHAFYTLWTRKEAFVKALGKGIDDDFKYMPCLDGQHDISATVLNETENWQVYSFNFAEDYSGAVCIEGLPKVPEVLKVYTLPNTMKELLELTQERKGQ